MWESDFGRSILPAPPSVLPVLGLLGVHGYLSLELQLTMRVEWAYFRYSIGKVFPKLTLKYKGL